MNVKKFSIEREKLYAKKNPDGRRRQMSGANPNAKGDFIRDDILEDIKSTKAESYIVKISELEKINLDAIEHDRAGVLVLDFVGHDKYYILSQASYNLFLQLLREDKNEGNR